MIKLFQEFPTGLKIFVAKVVAQILHGLGTHDGTEDLVQNVFLRKWYLVPEMY